jgi:hypothetical protein
MTKLSARQKKINLEARRLCRHLMKNRMVFWKKNPVDAAVDRYFHEAALGRNRKKCS